jgi:AraC-like DNA-binding protein
MVTICAVLSPQERPRLDAAGYGCFTTVHADSLRQARRAARQRRVDALVVSVQVCAEALPDVALFADEFPAVSMVALVSRHDSAVSQTLLRLGANGVRFAVDCTAAAGWHRLRDLVARPASPEAAKIIAGLRPALANATVDMRVFLENLAQRAPVFRHAGRLARHIGVRPATLRGRFWRARLPSPKAYLAGMRRLHATYLLANRGLSVAEVAHRLDYSSAAALRRHLNLVLGLTPREFSSRFPFAVALEGYVKLLITPYRETLRTFCPLNAGLWDQGSGVPRVSRKG